MHRLLNTLLLIVGWWVGLACGLDSDDRMLRRYARCMTDTNTALYRLTVSGVSGTVTLSAEAMEERLRGQLERGEFTMGKIRADYARYCEYEPAGVAGRARAKGALAGRSPVSEWSPQGGMLGAAWRRRNAPRWARIGWLERRPGGE